MTTQPSESISLTELQISDSMDVDLARRQAAFLASRAGLSPANQTRFATATADIAWNAVKHAGGGVVNFSLVQASLRQQLQALVCDTGPGIAHLERVLEANASEKRGGLVGVRRLVDGFQVDTGPERGTVVLLRKNLPTQTQTWTSEQAAEWVASLADIADIPAPNIIRQQNEELLAALNQLHQKEQDLRRQLRRIKRLNERLDLLSLVASQTDNGVIICDPHGRIEWVNEGFTRISGYRLSEIRGRKPGDFLQGPRTDPRAIQQMRDGVQKRESVSVEVLNYHRAGHTYWQLLTITPVFNRGGQLHRFIAVQSDITEQKQAEQALREKKEEAEQANRSRNEFLANISHEIRTPMNAIIGMTELTLGSPLTKQQRQNLELVKESSDSLLRLLNDVLNFSRLENGQFDIDRSTFALREMLDQTVRALAVQAHAKGLELAHRVPPSVPDLLIGDSARLRQVIVNIVGNAVKFTDQGEVELSVALDSRMGRDVLLHFSVRDTGPGITENTQKRIFRPFTQGDGALTRRAGGAGLGLAISHQLINLMGGRIWVRSESGAGSTFHFTIRCQLANPDQAQSPLPLELSDLRNLPVLVVDDNATNRRILVEVLENWQMQPAAAASAEEALKMMDQAVDQGEPFSLVLLDAVMPGTDGFALAEQITHRPELAQSTIMMLSSSDTRSQISSRTGQLDLAGFLTKPVTQSDLLDAILRAVGKAITPSNDDEVPRGGIVPSSAKRAILVAEDTEANQYLVRQILERRGHEVVVANDGQEALELWQHQVFDAVLMDVQMPRMDGFEATRRIRQLEEDSDRHTPIVAMTAHAMRGDRERCLAVGMDAYLAKPIDSREVISLVESFARRTPMRHHSATDLAQPQSTDQTQPTAPEPAATEAAPQAEDDEPTEILTDGSADAATAASEDFVVNEPTADDATGSAILTATPEVGTQKSNPNAPIDFAPALRRMNGNVDVFKSLIAMLRQNAPELMTQLRVAIAVGDSDAVARVCHRLRGTTATFNAERTVAVTQELEDHAKQGRLAEAPRLSAELHKEMDRLLRALNEFERSL